jgi:GAF domain-containing protein
MSMVPASFFPRVEEDRYVALLQAANAIATCSDCEATSDALVSKLREVTHFDFLHLVAFEKDANQSCFSLMDANGRRLDHPPADVLPLDDSPIQQAHDSGEAMVILDWSLEPRFQSYGRFLSQHGIGATCTLPLKRGLRRLGVLSLGRCYPNAYDEDEIRFLSLAADQIGLAIDAAVNFFIPSAYKTS